MNEEETLKEKLICIIPAVLLAIGVGIYLCYPLIFGIVEAKYDNMVVIEKIIRKTPETYHLNLFSIYTMNVEKQSEEKKYYLKTRQSVDVYKVNKEGSKTFLKTKDVIKEYKVDENFYDDCKVGTVLERGEYGKHSYKDIVRPGKKYPNPFAKANRTIYQKLMENKPKLKEEKKLC